MEHCGSIFARCDQVATRGMGPGSQATLACALKDSHEDDEVGNNEDGGDEPVDPNQDIDAEQFDDVVELPIDE